MRWYEIVIIALLIPVGFYLREIARGNLKGYRGI